MSEIPKLVTDRLRRSVVTTHPDADVLAAFAEKSLSDRERAPVLAHLAICADCREVVAVATLAELEPVSANVVQGEETAPGRSWFRWPVLRWGAAAACVVVVGAAVLYNTGSMQKRAMTVSDAEPELRAAQSSPPPSEHVGNSGKEQVDEYASGDRRQKTEARLVRPRTATDSISAGKPARLGDNGNVEDSLRKGVANTQIPTKTTNELADRDQLAKAKRADSPSLRERVEEATTAQGGAKKGEISAQEKALPGASGTLKAETEKDLSGVRLADKNAPSANGIPAAPAAAPLQAAKAAQASGAEKQDQKAVVMGQASETVEVSSEIVPVPSAESRLNGTGGSLTRGFATGASAGKRFLSIPG